MAQLGWKSSSNFFELAKPTTTRPTKKPKNTDTETAMEEFWGREKENTVKLPLWNALWVMIQRTLSFYSQFYWLLSQAPSGTIPLSTSPIVMPRGIQIPIIWQKTKHENETKIKQM